MLHSIFITNKSGSVLLERFRGFSAEECGQWRAFLVKLGQKDLTSAPAEEQFIACYGKTFAVYTSIGDIFIYLLGSDEYDELGLATILNLILDLLKDICKRGPTQASVLEKYGKICLCLDEVMAQGNLEHLDKERIKRLAKLKPLEAAASAAK